MNNLYYGHMFGGLGGFWMILFWILIVLFVIWIVMKIVENNSEKSKDKKPLDILRERYAKGEINKDEFEEKKKDLKN